jgi:hypothetical protein
VAALIALRTRQLQESTIAATAYSAAADHPSSDVPGC